MELLVNNSEVYPDYEQLRKDLLNLIEKYKSGVIKLNEIHWIANDFDDVYFSEGYDPEWENMNLFGLYSRVLFELDGFTWLFPEDISIIEEALNCKSENVTECIKKWEEYWADIDHLSRKEEGVKRGYWEDEENIDLPHLVALSKLFSHEKEK